MNRRSVFLSLTLVMLMSLGSFVFGEDNSTKINGNLPLIARLQQSIEALEITVEQLKEIILSKDESISIFKEWDRPIDKELIIGNWQVVNFVDRPEDFEFDENPDSYYLKSLCFNTDSVLMMSESGTFNTEWMDDSILHYGDRTVSEFMIVSHDSNTYMFWEWKSGDYSHQGMSPKYYVLKKCSDAFGEVNTFEELAQALNDPGLNDIYVNSEILIPYGYKVTIGPEKTVILNAPLRIEGELVLDGKILDEIIISSEDLSAINLDNVGILSLMGSAYIETKSEISINQNARLVVYEGANVFSNYVHEIGPAGSDAKKQVANGLNLERAALMIMRNGDGILANIVYGNVAINYSNDEERYDLYIIKGDSDSSVSGTLRIPNYDVFKSEEGTNNRFLVAGEFGATVIIGDKIVLGRNESEAILTPDFNTMQPGSRILIGGNGESKWISIYGQINMNKAYNDAAILGNDLWINGVSVPSKINIRFNAMMGDLQLSTWNDMLPTIGTYEFKNGNWTLIY